MIRRWWAGPSIFCTMGHDAARPTFGFFFKVAGPAPADPLPVQLSTTQGDPLKHLIWLPTGPGLNNEIIVSYGPRRRCLARQCVKEEPRSGLANHFKTFQGPFRAAWPTIYSYGSARTMRLEARPMRPKINRGRATILFAWPWI